MEINALEQGILTLEEKNRDISDLIAYFQTESFQEKEVRRKLNLQKPGEHVVVLPDGQASGAVDSVSGGEQLAEQKNWKKWWEYFFGT